MSPIYQKRWKVKYELRTLTNTPVKTFTSYFNPYLYLPDTKDSVVSDNFNLGNVTLGSYKLVMYIQDTTEYHPNLFLNITSPVRNNDGSYTLVENITVSPKPLPLRNLSYIRVNNNRTTTTIYPNPAADYLYIQLQKNIKKPVQVELWDITGKLIIKEITSSDNFIITVATIPKSLYLLNKIGRAHV